MNIPENLKYTKDHEWLKMIDDKTAYVGITDHAQSELGELVYIEVESIGEMIDKDEVFGTVEAVKTTSELFLPVSAKILEFNPEIDENESDNPGAINESPYETWIVKIELENTSDFDNLLTAEDYKNLIS